MRFVRPIRPISPTGLTDGSPWFRAPPTSGPPIPPEMQSKSNSDPEVGSRYRCPRPVHRIHNVHVRPCVSGCSDLKLEIEIRQFFRLPTDHRPPAIFHP